MSTFQDYIPIYEGDRYCLMCRHVCPVERVTKREATTPHGWALLIASVNRGMLKWDAETVDTLYQCADCGLCQANCATDRPLPAALVAARAEVVRLHLMPASVTALDEKLRVWGNPYRENPAAPPPGEGRPGGAGLFVGAAAQFLRPQAVHAAKTLLLAAGPAAATGDSPTILSAGRSSGYLPYTVGLWDTARSLAEQTLDEIQASGVHEVITLCAEDAHTLRHVYAELGLKLPEQVQVIELVELLAREVQQGKLKIRKRDLKSIAYHDPCHTPRLLARAQAARQLVAALTGSAPREMLWRENRAAPCGAVGGLEYTQPTLAADMARARLAEARNTGAEILLTDDPHCAAHLEKHTDGFQVLNLIELLAESL